MINNNYMELPTELAAESSTLFLGEDEKESFVFLRKYLKYIENDDACYSRLFLTEDPLMNKRERKKRMLEFNLRIHRFLDRLTRHGNKMLKKTYSEGDVACYLGVAYEYGLFGMNRNSEMAFRHYTIAAQLKSSLGTFRLAQCYERGFGTAKNLSKAVYFFRCSAKLGLPDGMHVYGTILANGYLGCEADPKMGLHFLSLACLKASAEYPHALFDVGNWYEDASKVHTLLPDNNYALEVYLQGAEFDEPNCQYRVAQIYEDGLFDEEVDMMKAFKFYEMASANGQVDAQLRLSEILFTGIPGKVSRSASDSYLWALKAATKRNARGAYIVGEYALRGFGTEKDILVAWWWFNISYKLGNKEAQARVIELTRIIMKIDIGPHNQPSCCKIFCLDIC